MFVREGRFRVASGFLLGVLVAIRGYPNRVLDGIPFDAWPEYGFLAACVWLFLPAWKMPGRSRARAILAILAAAIFLKAASGFLAAERGLASCIRVEGVRGCARSPAFPDRRGSRLDRAIDFEGLSAGASLDWFPLDVDLQAGEDIQARPVRVVWTGFFDPETPGAHRFVLDARPPGRIEVAGIEGEREVTVDLADRAVPIRIEYAFVPLESPRISLRVQAPGDVGLRLATEIFPEPPPANWRGRDLVAFALSMIALAVVLAFVGWVAASALELGRRILAALSTPAGHFAALWSVSFLFAFGVLAREARQEPTFELVTNGDAAIYVSQAKSIAVDGPFFTKTAAHRSPTVRWYVWCLHRLGGTGHFHPLLWQAALYALGSALLYPITVTLSGSRLAGAAASLALGVNGDQFDHATSFQADPLGMILVIASLAALTAWRARGGRMLLAAGGLFYGLASVTRADLAIGIPIVAVWSLLSRRDFARPWLVGLARALAVSFAATIPFLALGLENRVTMGRWIFMQTSGPVNFLIGNQIPREWLGHDAYSGDARLDRYLDEVYRKVADFTASDEEKTNPEQTFDPVLTDVYHEINPYLRRAAANYVREHPGHFAAQVARKVNRFLWQGGIGRHYLPYTTILALSLVALARARLWRAYSLPLALLPAFVLGLSAFVFYERHRMAATALILILSGPLGASLFRLAALRLQRFRGEM